MPNCIKNLGDIQKHISVINRRITIKMNRFHVQSKVVDIHESLNVENLTDVHAENFFLQKIRKVN